MKKLLIIILFILFLWWLTPWYFCHGLKHPFHFSIYQLNFTLDNLIHNDISTPFALIRFYHNKITIFGIEFITRYLLFWDIKFLVNIISFTGVFGLLCGIWYFGKDILHKWYLKLLIIMILLFPIVEIFINPPIVFPLKITLFSLPFEIFSLLGITKLLERHNKLKIFALLTVLLWLTIWWHRVLPWESLNFCQ